MFHGANKKSSRFLIATFVLAFSTNAAHGQDSDNKLNSPPAIHGQSCSSASWNSSLIAKSDSDSDSPPSPAVNSTNPNRPIRDKWAIVVGIGSFKDPSIPHLTYATKDARDFYSYLIKEGNFQKDHVRLLLDDKADQRRILSEVGTRFLARLVHPDDLVVIFLSTHGSPSQFDIKGKNFLIAYDSDPTDLFTTGIEMQSIFESVKRRVSTDRIVMILDACHSGATDPSGKGMGRTGNFDAEEIAQGSGQLVICSSLPQEQSFESKRYSNGVFTKQLLNGLHAAGPRTTLGAAFNFLEKAVPEEVGEDYPNSTQTPTKRGQWNGNDLILTAPASAPHIVPPTVLAGLKPDSTQEPSATPPQSEVIAQTIPLPKQPIARPPQPQTPGKIQVTASPPPTTSTATPSHTPAATAVVTPTTINSIFRKKWALVIGLSNYLNPVLNLHFGAKDAQDFYQYLIGPGNFARENVILLTNEQATRSAILDIVDEKLPVLVNPEDLFVFFLSGHVSQSDYCNALITYDTDYNKLFSTAIQLRDITSAISNRLKSQRNLLIIDGLAADTTEKSTKQSSTVLATATKQKFGQSNLPSYYFNQGKGTIILASRQAGQGSWESNRYSNGVFTRQLIQGLLSKGDHTSISEAFSYARMNTDKEVWEDRKVHQTPTIQSTWNGIELHPAIKMPEK